MSDKTLFNILLSIEGLILLGVVIIIILALQGVSLVKICLDKLEKLQGTKEVIKHNTDAMKELKDAFQASKEASIRLDTITEKNQERIIKELDNIRNRASAAAPS